jgi:hypothetical protein
MSASGGCHLSVTIGSASTSCRGSALRSAYLHLRGNRGVAPDWQGLGADYGPVRIRPALSATDYFDAEDLDKGRGYFFAGTQGGVGRNIFLGGNSFRTSPSVSKKNLISDAQGRFSVLWSKSLRVDISVALFEQTRSSAQPDGAPISRSPHQRVRTRRYAAGLLRTILGPGARCSRNEFDSRRPMLRRHRQAIAAAGGAA